MVDAQVVTSTRHTTAPSSAGIVVELILPPGVMGTIFRRPSPESPTTWGCSTGQESRKIGSRRGIGGVHSGMVDSDARD